MAGRVVSLLIWGVSSPIFKKFLFPPDPNQRVGRNSENCIPPIQGAGRRNTVRMAPLRVCGGVQATRIRGWNVATTPRLRPVPFAKIFLFLPDPNHLYIPRRLVPTRGVSRSSRTRDGMRWTRQRFARDVIAGRVLWTCERSTAR